MATANEANEADSRYKKVREQFDSALPAPPRKPPMPKGLYTAKIVNFYLTTTFSGDNCYKMVFEIVAPEEFKERRLQRGWLLTPDAIAYTKRDLAALGFMSWEDLMQPIPRLDKDILVSLSVAVVRKLDGDEYNLVKSVKLLTNGPATVTDNAIETQEKN